MKPVLAMIITKSQLFFPASISWSKPKPIIQRSTTSILVTVGSTTNTTPNTATTISNNSSSSITAAITNQTPVLHTVQYQTNLSSHKNVNDFFI